MFVIFFFLLSIVALNVLVGLTVDDIRNFLDNANLRELSLRLQFLRNMEHHSIHTTLNQVIDPRITRNSHFKIWEKFEKKQKERRNKAQLEEERRNIKVLIDSQTASIKSELKDLKEIVTLLKIGQNQSKS